MLYRFMSRLVHRVWLPPGKLRASLSGRRGAAQRWMQWASTHRTDEHRIWVHAASVGEFCTAEPVVRRLRQTRGVGQVVCSFSSPSMAGWPDRDWADAVDYIPLDEPRPIGHALRAVAPSLIIFARGDLWPEFVHGAKRLAIPLAVIGGMKRRASKLHWLPKHSAVRSVCMRLDWVGTNSGVDRERWKRAGVPESAIEVTGDPRHDQVLERIVQQARVREFGPWRVGNALLVAGSTNHEDDRLLLRSFRRVLSVHSCARLMIIPHEHNVRQVQKLARDLDGAGISHQIWSEGPVRREARCIVVTKLGVLADLYAFADLAYVGGGFRRGGLHAVAEPAAYAVPVITGPRFRDSMDAERMVEAGGAVALPRHGSVDVMVGQWKAWIDNANERWRYGLRARQTLQEGAARRSVDALLRLTDGRL